MGSTSLTSKDDAFALTPSLFLGYYLSIEHDDFVSVEQAVSAISNGRTILVNDGTVALEIMLRLGITPSGALHKLHRATTVVPDTETIDL